MSQNAVTTHSTITPLTANHGAAVAGMMQPPQMCAGLTVRVYDMPPAVDHYVQDVQPALSVGILTHGAMRLGVRQSAQNWCEQDVQQGDLFLRPPHSEPRELRWRTQSRAHTSMLNVYVPPDLLFRTVEDVYQQNPLSVVFRERSGFQDPLLVQLGQALCHALDQPTPLSSLYAETAAQMLAVHLLRFYSDHRAALWEPSRGLTGRQVQRIHAYVQRQLTHDLTLRMLAQQVGLSPYHFARMFRLTTGESPHQYVLRQRLAEAERLLTTTDLPLIEVAVASGFGSQSYLTTVFKRRLGLTPRAYRRLIQ